ncbi:MAG: SpoIIE family protein phosphatase [Luteolibacter sp.]|uniref:SpoIIE family protein phosphatase n=1 Tax=Luteolibacter sp. TaxID=1962973 RepID=UPI0032649A86
MNENPEILRERNVVKLERLELALRASNEGIWDWQIDQQDIFYSRRILEFIECGTSRAPNLFIPPYENIHAEEQRAFELAVTQALQDGGPETLAVDARVRTGSGDWRWLRIRGTVVRDREGKARRVAGSMINISLRKAAEAQVEEERHLLRQLIDHVPLQIYFKDLNSNFSMANQGMAEWMGFDHERELIGKHDRDFFDFDHWKPAEDDEKRIIETGEPIIDQLEHETWHEGTETWVITSKFPWRGRQGQIKGTFGVSSDVTKLVQAEREATHLAHQLQLKNEAYEEELLLAREIQQALAGEGFPTANGSDGSQLLFGARYIPISGLAGDFFEVMKVTETSFGVLICDVMGHGVRSALIVAMLRGLLEKQRAQANEPGHFLQGLNDGLAAILERAGTTMFATAFYGLIDLDEGTFRYACAGHPGPIIAGRNGVRQIANERAHKGPGLGLIHGACYPTNEIELSDIRRMILFTDGVLEAENQSGEPFFENRLMEIIRNQSDEPLEQLLDGILSSVLAFSEGQHFDDDVCLLGIEISRAE